MGVPSVIFVSGVSKELKSARELVANILRGLGYEPSWEDIPDDERDDLRVLLQRKIDASRGVIQLVGLCYGAEPPLSERPGGRVSYTQYEAHYARQCGKKVWYLILDKAYPADPCEPESKELRTLQAAYIRRVRNYSARHHPIHNPAALEAKIFSLRGELDPLRRAARLWTASVALVLTLSIGGALWFAQRQSRAAAEERKNVPALSPAPSPRFR